MGVIAKELLSLYAMTTRRAREPMAGGINHEYAEKFLTSRYGDNIYTNAVIAMLPALEDIEIDWRNRKKPKK